MSAGKAHPWDAVVSQEEWNDYVGTENGIPNAEPSSIESASFDESDDVAPVDFSDLSDAIADINAANAGITKERLQAEQSALEEAVRKEEELEQARINRINRERYERERAEKDAREFAEQEEFARKRREEIERRQNSAFGKIAGVFKKKPQPAVAKEGAQDEQKESATEAFPEVQTEALQTAPRSEAAPAAQPEPEAAPPVPQAAALPKARAAQGVLYGEEPEEAQPESEEPAAQPIASAPAPAPEDPPAAQAQPEKQKKKRAPFIRIAAEEEPEEEPGVPEPKQESGAPEQPDWEYLATHDEMTGLKNVRAYELEKAKKRRDPFAVVYIDVNNLKYANDKFSHEVGNLLIKSTADSVKENIPGTGFRTGGDEFIAIVECVKTEKQKDALVSAIGKAKAHLDKATESAPDGVVVSASFGFAVSEKGEGFASVAERAEKAMYAEKAAYKRAHPEFDMRGEFKKPQQEDPQQPQQLSSEDYDSRLTKDQQLVKKRVHESHRTPNTNDTIRILAEIQNRAAEVRAILIASPTFEYLFIIHSVDMFASLVTEMQSVVDYSYLYVLYDGGPQYYGSDEYYAEITDLFTSIGRDILSGKLKSEKDYKRIKGINIFRNIRFA